MIISYAQNFEDVMLWRALKHVKRGFYIDIGAQDPMIDSVSLAFYERGWRGIHVEPTAHYANLLRKSRPDEIVIQAAVGSDSGVLTFFEFPETGLSTSDRQIAEKHVEAGFQMSELIVPCSTLAHIFSQCTESDVHWLKIDVEGYERHVLEGWQRVSTRPWIVVVESTLPLSQIDSYQEWEALILDRGYRFVYFDGLNRFYISDAHLELLDKFRVGPNIFDGFSLSGTASAPFCGVLNAKIHTLEEQLHASRQQTIRVEGELDSERQRAVQLGSELGAGREPVSRLQARSLWLQNDWDTADWVVVLPKRMVRSVLRLPKSLMVWVIRQVLANPGLKARALGMLAERPRLYQRLREFAARSGLLENTIATASAPNMSEESIKNLSPLAARIYADLKKAIDTRKS
jgi:FkbM family methyltransferase